MSGIAEPTYDLDKLTVLECAKKLLDAGQRSMTLSKPGHPMVVRITLEFHPEQQLS